MKIIFILLLMIELFYVIGFEYEMPIIYEAFGINESCLEKYTFQELIELTGFLQSELDYINNLICNHQNITL